MATRLQRIKQLEKQLEINAELSPLEIIQLKEAMLHQKYYMDKSPEVDDLKTIVSDYSLRIGPDVLKQYEKQLNESRRVGEEERKRMKEASEQVVKRHTVAKKIKIK